MRPTPLLVSSSTIVCRHNSWDVQTGGRAHSKLAGYNCSLAGWADLKATLRQRGISLLWPIAGKVLIRVLLNRLSYHVYSNDTIPESQSGLCTGRGTMDMIFTARQLQEKCREQHRDMYAIFIDLTKAFDPVSRWGLWMVLRRIGCPEKFVEIIQSFHDGMQGEVIDEGELSELFGISNGTKQGCPSSTVIQHLFCHYVTGRLQEPWYRHASPIPTRWECVQLVQASSPDKNPICSDQGPPVCWWLCTSSTLTEWCTTTLWPVLRSSHRFGLTVSLKKTEVMLQPSPDTAYIPPVIRVGDVTLNVVDKFCYLGSFFANTTNSESDITARLSKASSALGRLTKRLWDDHGIRLDTKVTVYKAAVLTVLLYGFETWVLYRRHVAKLDQFQMRCLQPISSGKIRSQTLKFLTYALYPALKPFYSPHN